MISPTLKYLNDSPVHTLSKILENPSPTSQDRGDTTKKEEGADFANFHGSLRYIPKRAEKNSITLLPRASLPKINSSVSPIRASPIKPLGQRTDSLAESPSNHSRILGRKGTLELQLLKPFGGFQSPSNSPPLKARGESPSKSGKIDSLASFVLGESPKHYKKNGTTFTSAGLQILERKLAAQQINHVKGSQSFVYKKPKHISHAGSVLSLSGVGGLNTTQNGESYIIQKTEVGELDQDDKHIANQIQNEGMKNFKQTINIHHRVSPSHLFESGETLKSQQDFSLKPRPIIVKKSRPGTRDLDLQNASQKETTQPFDLFDMLSEKRQEEKKRPRLDLKFPPECDMPESRSKSTKASVDKVFKVKTSIDMGKLNDSHNLKLMRDLGTFLKSDERPLNVREKEFLNLVKEGTQLEELELMIRNNRDLVNIKDNRKESPLHWAIKKDHFEIVDLLCSYGADLNAVDIALRKPMDIALRLRRNKIIRFLEKLE